MRTVLAALMLCLSAVPSSAHLVTVQSAAGRITVASEVADRFVGFISDVSARGFRGPVHCYASSGHVRHSNHYTGHGCDFAQRGWGRTVAPMYHIADLAAKWGLRDGCTFRDCGHVDLPSGGRVTRHASRRHGRRYRRYAGV